MHILSGFKICVVVLMLAAGTTLWAAGASERDSRADESAERVTLEVGYLPILPVAQFFVVEGAGWAAEAGIDFEATRFPNGPAIVQALASGELDIVYFGIGPAMVARSRGQAIKVVAANIIEQIALIARGNLAAYWDEDDPAGLFARFEAGEGRKAKIATFPAGSVPNTVLRYWLDRRLNIGSDVAEIIGMGADQVQQALLTDSVDAASILEPVLTIVQDRDADTSVLARSQQMFPNQPGAVIAVREDVLERYPEAIEKLLALHIRATELLRNNPEQAVPFVAEFIGQGLVDDALLLKALRSPSVNYVSDPREIVDSTKIMHDFQLEQGSLAQPVDLEQLFDASYYERASRAGR